MSEAGKDQETVAQAHLDLPLIWHLLASVTFK